MKGRIAVVAVLLVAFAVLYSETGFLQADSIDSNDQEAWQFQNGVIVGAEGFTLQGTSGECWVMVHGYTSTPDELRIVAEAITNEFNDVVYVPRLDGHGMVPSALLGYSVDHWYKQVVGLAEQNKCKYLLGSSMGAMLALRYAETHKVKGVVSVGAPFSIQPYYLPAGKISGAVASTVTYTKRKKLGETIDDVSARSKHITGYSFPLAPVGEVYEFTQMVNQDLQKITANILFLHAQNDRVAYIGGAKEAFEGIGSNKTFIELKGNHVVFRDFEKEKAVNEVVKFRNY